MKLNIKKFFILLLFFNINKTLFTENFEIAQDKNKLKRCIKLITKNSLKHFDNQKILRAGMPKDTVVQVFSLNGYFNWLEPYKTPNQAMASGTGFFINDKGHLVTNAHVINQAKAICIQIPSMGKEQFDVEVIGICFDRDLALLKLKDDDYHKLKLNLNNKISFLELGDSDKVNRENEVIVFGYPLGQQSYKSTKGIVSGRETIVDWNRQLIQIDAAINPGNSGGPVLDLSGKVIGIATGNFPEAQKVGYIIPINELKIILDDLYNAPNKLLRKPFLVFDYNSANPALTNFLGNPLPGGCYVSKVFEGSMLDQAGIKVGDMIYEVNNQAVDIFGDVSLHNCEDKISLMDYASFISLNSEVTFIIYRNGKRLEIKYKFSQSKLPEIRYMHSDYEKIDYEIIGGLVVMQLTRNHLPLLIKYSTDLIKYEKQENQINSVLVITHIHPNSQAQRTRVIRPGSIIKEVNGVKVKNLEEFRSSIKNSISTGYLTLKFDNEIFTVLSFKKVLEDELKLPYIYKYPVTSFVQELMLNLPIK